jgi:hypothetical protein
MGDGLKRAALAAIATNTWTISDGMGYPKLTLTDAQVVALYDAIREGRGEPWKAVRESAVGFSHRDVGRALEVLKRAKLIVYVKAERRWVATE